MRVAILALVSCALLVGLSFSQQSGAETTVVSLSHLPVNPTPDDNVTVTLQLTNSSEVNKTYISWCQAKPELCYTPRCMTYIGEHAYSFNLGKNVDGQEIKYNVTILFKNGTSSVTDTIHFTVKKPSNGNNNTTNNTNTTGDGSTGQAGPDYLPFIALAVVLLAAAVAVAVFVTRKKKPGSP